MRSETHDLARTATTEARGYLEAGASRAQALANRGPLRFGADGRLAPEILEAYRRTGFYIFEGVIGEQELAEFDADLVALLDRTPVEDGAALDRRGRQVAADARLPQLLWARPLSDPWGGTSLINGRHPVRMEEPVPTEDSPASAVFLMLGLYESMGSALRLSAHPDMLRVAEALAGPDFVPYNDSIFLKEPGLGASIAWHQDGTTHWDSPDWHPDIHGFNFMAQLCRTTPANALWVVPGSHRCGHIDIPALVAENRGSTRLPDAVPMLCNRGDVAVCNRQCLHGSFANASPDRRVSFVWGFFARDAVLDVQVDVPVTRSGDVPATRRYTAEAIRERCRLVQLAIDARQQHAPDEAGFCYAPFQAETLHWSDPERERALHRYAGGTIFI